MLAPDPRRLAWQVLVEVDAGAYADVALGHRLRGVSLATRDRALATRLVYGTLAWQGLLDHVIARCVRVPARLDPPVRALLRMAFYQLVRLDRIPDFAVVDTAVELAKEFRAGAATGLVNAALRRFLREGKDLALPPRDADVAAYLAVAQSHPRWLVEQWLAELGETEAEALLTANNAEAPTAVRVNGTRAERDAILQRLAAAQIPVRATEYSPDGIAVEPAGDPAALPGYAEGLFSLQGEASQLIGWLAAAAPGARVLDACAAPGGKALHLAERMAGRGLVVAMDRQVNGLRLLRHDADRLGLRGVAAACADAAALPLGGAERFDVVLVDAPCSGLGTLRQHPEIKWRRRPADIAALAERQRRLLDSLAPHVCGGGALVYATCTIARAESESVVAAFLAGHPTFTLDDPRPALPAAARSLVGADGYFRTFPHRHGLDGFFAARLKRS